VFGVLFTLRRDRFRDVLDERSLSCATRRNVADADHRTIEFRGLKSPAPVQRQSRARDCAV
jgi:hypothetical protein